MKIGSIKENLEIEQRISVTPEIIKKYKSLNLNIILPKGYGTHLGISDEEFQKEGAEILESNEKVISEADTILQMSLISENNLDVIYPCVGENYHYLKKCERKYKINFNYIYKKEDIYCWSFSRKGFFNFKKNIPHIIEKLGLRKS